MNQFSGDGSPIELELISRRLIFIDPLYLEEIRIALEIDEIRTIQVKQDIPLIEAKVFPYGGGTLIGYKQLDRNLVTYNLDIHDIRSVNLDDEVLQKKAINKDITSFSIDSGSFLIIDLANLNMLIRLLTYDALDKFLQTEGIQFIIDVNAEIGNKGWAYVLSPGIDSGFEFEGDGSYIIN